MYFSDSSVISTDARKFREVRFNASA